MGASNQLTFGHMCSYDIGHGSLTPRLLNLKNIESYSNITIVEHIVFKIISYLEIQLITQGDSLKLLAKNQTMRRFEIGLLGLMAN